MQRLGLQGVPPLKLTKHAIKNFLANDMLTYSAALACSILFALFPFLIFLIALLGALNIERFFDWLLQTAGDALPESAFSMVETVIGEVRGQSNGGVLSIGIILAIWAASSGVRSVMNAMNVAFHADETRPMLRRYVLSVIFTLGIAGLIVASAALILLGPDVVQWISDHAGFGDVVVTVWTWLRWPLLTLLLIIILALVYNLAPNVDQPFRIISPGAIVAVILWLIGSFAFSYYVSSFSNYSATYGSLAGIIVLLFFLYLSNAVLLLGAEVNAEYERLAAAEETSDIPSEAITNDSPGDPNEVG